MGCVTMLVIQVRTFPLWGKSSNRNDVRYGQRLNRLFVTVCHCLSLSVTIGRGHYDHSQKPHIRGFSVSGLFCCCRAGGYSPVCGSPYRHQAHQREAFFIFRGYKKSMGLAVRKRSGHRDLTRPSLCISTISDRRRNSALGTYI